MMPLTSNVPFVGSNFTKKGTSMDIRDAIKANNTARAGGAHDDGEFSLLEGDIDVT